MDDSALKTLLGNLDASRGSLHWWLHFWTFLVVVGVALEVIFVVREYIDERHDFRRGIVRPPDKPSVLLFALGLLGVGLVAIGVAGELSVDVQAGKVETEIRKANELRFSLLKQKADDVASEADAVAARLRIALRQLGQLEKGVAAQGPRAKLLAKVAPQLAKELTAFAGQKIELFVCGQQGVAEQETMDTWGGIANILDSDTVAGVTGAKWKLVPTNLTFAGNCGAAKGLGQGVIVFVSKRASRRTRWTRRLLWGMGSPIFFPRQQIRYRFYLTQILQNC